MGTPQQMHLLLFIAVTLAMLGGARPVRATALFHHDAAIGLTLRLPPGWKRLVDDKAATAAGPVKKEAIVYTDSRHIARVRFTVTKQTLVDISLLPTALEEAQRRGAIRVNGTPRLAQVAGYPCVRLEMAPAKGAPLGVGALFLYFFTGRYELSIRLVAAGPRWQQLVEAFERSLAEMSIRDIPRGAPPGPIAAIDEHDAIAVAPAGFKPLRHDDSGDTLARFGAPVTDAIFDITWHRKPLRPVEELTEQFFASLAERGFDIGPRRYHRQGRWPAVWTETKATLSGEAVTAFFNLVFVHDRIFQLTGTCRRRDAARYARPFEQAALAFRVGPPRHASEFYHNPSFVARDGSPRELTVEMTARLRDCDSPIGDATLMLPLAGSYPPYQQLTLEGWSQSPDHLVFDEWGSAMVGFNLEEVGRRPRQAVHMRYRLTVTPMTVRPEAGAGIPLSPRVARALMAPTPMVPRHHPRIAKAMARHLEGTARDAISRVQRLLSAIADEARGQPAARHWHQGALFALAKPREASAADRVSLFAAMVRDLGFPVRRIYGHLLPPQPGAGSVLPHAWCEVFLPPAGWVPADPTPLSADDEPRLGRWSSRYLYLSHEGPPAVEQSGPDAARLWPGHRRASLERAPCVIEVERRAMPTGAGTARQARPSGQ